MHHFIEVGEYGLALEQVAGFSRTHGRRSLTRSATACWPWQRR
jgi:hypothetical protein